MSRLTAARMLRKVPEVTLYFWIIKVLATTVGETAADFLGTNLHLSTLDVTVIMSALLTIVLVFQFRARKYVPALYWLAIVLISVVGTLFSDNLVDNLGVPLQTTTILFSIALAVVFAAWYASEKTLSIHSIYTRKREAFYWLAILFTFALGTSAGDLVAEQLNVGYAWSLVLFAAVIAAVFVAYRVFKLNAVLAFWVAYILTRPLGASTGDLLSQPRAVGGLGLGTSVTSALFLLAIVSVVVYLSISKRDVDLTRNETDALARDVKAYLSTEIRDEDDNAMARLRHWARIESDEEIPPELLELVHRLIRRHEELVASAEEFLAAVETGGGGAYAHDSRHVKKMKLLVDDAAAAEGH
jgi:uncharacterized membrane-anchored protein